jgi:hypothetical protein
MEWIYFQTVLPLALVAFIVWWTWPKSESNPDDREGDLHKYQGSAAEKPEQDE